jgi:peptide/nickel transport system permease protein
MTTTSAASPNAILDLRAAEAMPEEVSQIQLVVRRFLRHKLAVVALFVLAIVLVLAVFGPSLMPFTPTEIAVGDDFLAPGSLARDGTRVHYLGTDHLGRDYLSRIVYAARISLTVAITAQLFSSAIGIVVGAVSGYLGGAVDSLIMRAVEFLLTIPQLPLLLILSSIVIQNADAIPIPEVVKEFVAWLLLIPPREATQVVLVISVLVAFGWLGDSRLMRAVVLSVKEQTFTEASRALGASHVHIIFQHMIPNALAPMIVSASLSLSGFIIYEAALSFLGLGIQDPTPTWGNMLSAAQSWMFQYPWLPLISGIPIFLCSLTFNFVGDGLRDALDPRLKL